MTFFLAVVRAYFTGSRKAGNILRDKLAPAQVFTSARSPFLFFFVLFFGVTTTLQKIVIPSRRRKEVEDHEKAHPARTDVARGRRHRASISVIGVRGRRLIDDPRDRNDVSQNSRFVWPWLIFFPRFFVAASARQTLWQT